MALFYLISFVTVLSQVHGDDCVDEVLNAQPHDISNLCTTQPNWAVLPNPHDCHKFYVCANNVAEEYQCMKNYYFDHEELFCKRGSCSDTKECESLVRPVAGNCREFEICERGIYVNMLCRPGDYFDQESGMCIAVQNTPNFKCRCMLPQFSVMEKLNDCASYYACVDGEAVVQQCPRGQYFNTKLNTCLVDLSGVCLNEPLMTPQEIAMLAICERSGLDGDNDNGNSETSNGYMAVEPFLADNEDCNKYYICSRGRVMTKHCPINFYFDREAKNCQLDTQGYCEALRKQQEKKKEEEEKEASPDNGSKDQNKEDEKENDKEIETETESKNDSKEKEEDKDKEIHGDNGSKNHQKEAEIEVEHAHREEHEIVSKPPVKLSLSLTHVNVGVEKGPTETEHTSETDSFHAHASAGYSGSEKKTEIEGEIHHGERAYHEDKSKAQPQLVEEVNNSDQSEIEEDDLITDEKNVIPLNNAVKDEAKKIKQKLNSEDDKQESETVKEAESNEAKEVEEDLDHEIEQEEKKENLLLVEETEKNPEIKDPAAQTLHAQLKLPSRPAYDKLSSKFMTF